MYINAVLNTCYVARRQYWSTLITGWMDKRWLIRAHLACLLLTSYTNTNTTLMKALYKHCYELDFVSDTRKGRNVALCLATHSINILFREHSYRNGCSYLIRQAICHHLRHQNETKGWLKCLETKYNVPIGKQNKTFIKFLYRFFFSIHVYWG